jgi:hypothetical protein
MSTLLPLGKLICFSIGGEKDCDLEVVLADKHYIKIHWQIRITQALPLQAGIFAIRSLAALSAVFLSIF